MPAWAPPKVQAAVTTIPVPGAAVANVPVPVKVTVSPEITPVRVPVIVAAVVPS